jgi:prepilin-type N-terminal cleavage/methylation domain-containing protein
MIKRHRKAFTLIELLTVIAIIGILSSIAIISTRSSNDKAKLAAGQSFDASVYRGAGDQIIGEWLFDEGSGATAHDTSGNGYNGNITGAAWVAGMSGNALSFTPGNLVALGSSTTLNPVNFTVTAWVKPGDFSLPYDYIYSNARDCCGTYNGFNMFLQSNLLMGTIWNSTPATVMSVTKISNTPVWTFVAFSYNGSKMALYINGHLDNTATSALGVGSPASYPSYIGALACCTSLGFTGSIDQVRLYGSAIVAANIEKMYLAERDRYMAKK